jgi:hypothetical protein
MKIIITESQNYVLRRIQQLNDIVESEINDFENDDKTWWCREFNSSDGFFNEVFELSAQEFINHNWDFFHDEDNDDYSKESLDSFNLLNKIVEENYGNYIRILYHRKCP